jgi:hypothetical protein
MHVNVYVNVYVRQLVYFGAHARVGGNAAECMHACMHVNVYVYKAGKKPA